MTAADFWNGVSAIATAAATGVALYFGVNAAIRENKEQEAHRLQIARAAAILLDKVMRAVDALINKIEDGPIPFFPLEEVDAVMYESGTLGNKLRRFDEQWIRLAPQQFDALLIIEDSVDQLRMMLAPSHNAAKFVSHSEALPLLKKEREAIMRMAEYIRGLLKRLD